MIDMKMDNLDDVAACLYRLNDAVKESFEAYKNRIDELEYDLNDLTAHYLALERYTALLDTRVRELIEEKTND